MTAPACRRRKNDRRRSYVAQVNTGRLDEAVTHFDALIAKRPGLVAARLGRGSARALAGDLREAVGDFGEAVAAAPTVADCRKRRGQALAALGRLDAALTDLDEAVRLAKFSDGPFDADLYHQRGAARPPRG